MDILKHKLETISKVFDIDKVSRVSADKNYITSYYTTNSTPYSLFHNRQGFTHMGLSKNGTYHPKDLYEIPKIIETYIRKINAHSVLELASGKGANSIFLAKRNNSVMFKGIDLTHKHVTISKKKAGNLGNVSFNHGDFHDLAELESSSTDLVFIVEALCHSDDTGKVLREVHRIMKPNGLFIIFDGYTLNDAKKLTDEEKIVQQLIERGMAVNTFKNYEAFKDLATENNFTLEYEEDLSAQIIPSLKRFERLATYFFLLPPIAKLTTTFLPSEFLFNAISGYLMIDAVEQKLAGYYQFVLSKIDRKLWVR